LCQSNQIDAHLCFQEIRMNALFNQLKAHVSKRITISDDAMEYFASLAEVKHLKKRQRLLEAGSVSRIQTYVNKGSLRLFYTDEKLHDHLVQWGFEDWWVADLTSFLTGEPAQYSIDALEDCELLIFQHDQIEALYVKFPVFERYFRILIQNAVVAAQKRIIVGMSENAEERYLRIIKKFPQIEARVAQHQIASYLGISPEALSRLKRALIERERGRKS